MSCARACLPESKVGNPIEVVAAVNPVSWSLADPLFGFDASFYVFRLPILNRFQTLGSLTVFWIALLAIAAYIATGAIRMTERKLSVSILARRHIGGLAAAFLVFLAARVWLDRYGLIVDGNVDPGHVRQRSRSGRSD